MRGGTAITALAIGALAGCSLATFGTLDAPSQVGPSGAPDASTPVLGDDAGGDDAAIDPGDDASATDASTVPSGEAGADASPGGPDGGAGNPDAADAACPPTSNDASVGVAASISPAPVIDGDLSDWGCGPWTELDPGNAAMTSPGGGGASTLSGTFAVRWDADNLYVAVHSVVAKLRGNDGNDPYKNDAVEIYVSGDSPLTGDYDPQSHQYIVDWHGLAVDYGTGMFPPNQPTKSPPHFDAKTKVVPGGWQLEAKIEKSALVAGGASLGAGTSLSFDLQLDDGDGNQLQTFVLAVVAPHGDNCQCQNCCCGQGNDMPNCDTLCYGGLTLQ